MISLSSLPAFSSGAGLSSGNVGASSVGAASAAASAGGVQRARAQAPVQGSASAQTMPVMPQLPQGKILPRGSLLNLSV
jgi:hypothetical protein